MRTSLPSYVVAEMPEPQRSAIQCLRDALCPETARLPVEMTLAGSSGLGPIPENLELPRLLDALEKAFSAFLPFRISFAGFRVFPQTGIVYLSPADRAPFDRLHDALQLTKIPFTASPFAYTPHCTLRHGDSLPEQEWARIRGLHFPTEPFIVDTISVYGLNTNTLAHELYGQKKLRIIPDSQANH